MHIQYLLLFGLLYCTGSNEEKAKVFYDVLQDGLQETISANDKDLKDCFGRLIEMGTSNIHKWAKLYGNKSNKGVVEIFEKNDSQVKEWKKVIEIIKEKFLDDVFDVSSKIERKEFIMKVSKG